MSNFLSPALNSIKQRWGQLNQAQQDAAKMTGAYSLGALGVGGIAALMMNLRRANERKLLDEEAAKAILEVPVSSLPPLKRPKKEAGFPVGRALGAAGALGLGATGLALGNSTTSKSSDTFDTSGKVEDNFGNRVYNTTSGLPFVEAITNEAQRAMDPVGAAGGKYAKDWSKVPWFLPAVLGGSMLSLGAGYAGMNTISDAFAKRRLRKKRDAAKRMVEDALRQERGSKLGAALEEFVSAAEEAMPEIKEASLLESYLALMMTAGLAGGGLGAYNGYHNATQKHRLSALKKVRAAQLANRRREDLVLVPKEDMTQEDAEVSLPNASGEEKTAYALRSLGQGLGQGVLSMASQAAKQTASQAAKQQAGDRLYFVVQTFFGFI